MSKIKEIFRNQKLMKQIGGLFLILILAITAINLKLVYQNNLNVYIEERSEASLNLAAYVAEEMEQTEGMNWLLTYWRENFESMNIVYDSPEETKKRGAAFIKKHPQYQLGTVTEEDIGRMPANVQKEYAEYQYMAFMDFFNRLKRIYHPTYLFAFYPKSDSELFYYLTGTEEGERRGDDIDTIYRLGTISDWPKADYPVLVRTWEAGKVQEELEQPVKHGALSGFYHIYAPVNIKGRTVCLIGVTLETNTVKDELQKKLFAVEGMEILCFIFTGLLLFLLVHRVVLRPISRLQQSISEYEGDKDSQRAGENLAGIISKNEIGQLAGAFRGLTVEIDRHVRDIEHFTAEQERLKTELSLATKIQLDMIPRNYPEQKETSLAGIMEPAREVGGDFFDVFLVDENHLAVVIGDVSGKGIPAALFMVRSTTVIRNYAMLGLPVEEIFTRANAELCRGNESDLFTTAWLGIYEVDSGRLVFTEAGHDAPIYLRGTGETELLQPVKKKMPLGGMPGIRYVSTEIILKPGEAILLYTDGVPEANNEDEELYGMERFRASASAHASLVPQDVNAFLQEVRKDVSVFVGDAEQFDDLTMQVLAMRL